MATVSVRYIVDDVDESDRLLLRSPRVHRGDASGADLRDVVPRRPSAHAQRAGRSRRRGPGDARRHGAHPGGWNRFAIEVDGLEPLVDALRAAGAHFRNDIVTGVGGRQILVDDPSGNAVELFEPILPEAKLSAT